MFEWSVKSAITVKARAKDVWALWSDIGTWPLWNQNVEWSQLDGLFLVGSTGMIKIKKWPASTFTVTQIDEGKNFKTESLSPAAKMVFSHKMSSEGELVHLVHRITVSGIFAPILWLIMRNGMKKNLEKNINNLAIRVER